MTLAERFWPKVERGTSCWLWRGALSYGYGVLHRGEGRNVQAHRAAYELVVGEIPDGVHLHHRCGNKACVNPDHLELVTRREHGARHHGCDHGPDHRYLDYRGKSRCRICRREKDRARWHRRVAARVAE